MNEFITQFYDLFNLNDFMVSDSITLLQFLQGFVVVFVASMFVLVMFRFILEFVKIIMDWSRFK